MRKLFGDFFNQKQRVVRRDRKALQEELKKGPKSVSTLADATRLKTDLVMWNLMGMLRWGIVEVSGEENHELVFALKEV
ncbi:MAG: hypothetical protein ACFFEE_04585 [Candidatus Thorarchaeota archaeon]